VENRGIKLLGGNSQKLLTIIARSFFFTGVPYYEHDSYLKKVWIMLMVRQPCCKNERKIII